MAKILCICLSSTIQKTVKFKNLILENVNRSISYRLDASGKALNSARVLSQLDKNCVQSICPLGKENKSLFLKLAKRDNLKLEYVLIPGFTRECCTLLEQEKNTTTEIVVSEPEVIFDVQNCEKKLLKLIFKKAKKCDAVLFAGSKPKCFTENLIPQIAKIAINLNKIFLADYYGQDLLNTFKLCIPSIIKINQDEFIQTFGLDCNPNDSCFEDKLKQEITNKSQTLNNIIVVTRANQPAFAACKGTFALSPVEKINPVNTTACGDSFSAGFLFEYLNTKNFELALKKGTWCAARNAESEIPGSIN